MSKENSSGKPLVEMVEESLLQYIIDNDMQVGDKIPNEFVLAESLGVSRSTIREAVKLLVSRNILVIRRGAGTFISDKKGITEDPLGLSFVNDKYALAMDLLNVRIILEPEIASMAAINATDEEIEKIMEQCNKVEELYERGEDHGREDVRLHEMIAHCSRNLVIEKLIPIINTSVVVFADITKRKLKNETLTTHREIAEAIKAHDPNTAKYAMMMHLIYNRQMIASLIKEQKQSEAKCLRPQD